MKMEGSVVSGGLIKKKSSSGCLVIKKKGGDGNSGGLRDSSDHSKVNKRPRVVESGCGSSSSNEDESLEFMRRKLNEKRLRNGNSAGAEIGRERKRSRLDLFEFDEYDEFDGTMMRNEYSESRYKAVRHSADRDIKGSSSRDLVVDKRKQGSHFHGSGSSSGKSKGLQNNGVRNKELQLEEDEAHMSISLLKLKYQEPADEPIRLQGKNGVLKVMVNKKKQMSFASRHKNYYPKEVKDRKISRSDDVEKLPFSPPSKPRGLSLDKEKRVEKEKRDPKLEKVKPVLNKTSKARDSDVDGTDTVLKLAPPGVLACTSKKGVKEEESFTPVKKEGKEAKEGKAKRGGSTEKQMLREKIRGILTDAGWTIDYRPRRNRDYWDAVYINPSGTAYWSIVKAYDAFKKQLGEDNGKSISDVDSPSLDPLSEDINKLTRQTKRKIERERRRKKKEDFMAKSAARESSESSDSDHNNERLGTYMKQKSKSREGKFSKVDQESDDSPKRKLQKAQTKSNVIQGRTSGRCTLLVRGSVRGENSDSDGYVPYDGKRTLLAWLIDSGTATLSEKVQYMNRRRTRVMLEGWVTREGIHCGCCSKILAVSKFELHAGSKLRQPFQNIFLESGSSLLQCQLDAWNKQEESVQKDFFTVDVDGDDPDDDTCGICGDGGELICCDSCPSTFHQICLGMQRLPSGDWHCPNCTCKFCGLAGGNVGENDSTEDELKRCSFCEEKYHNSCSESVCLQPSDSSSASFCGSKCKEMYDHLQKILGVKHELEAGFSWSLIQRTDVSDTSLRAFSQKVECNSKLAVALLVMNECFLPIADRKSGINIIQNVVYNCGSNFNRLDYRGFYTVILERSDEILAAASIRIHGTRLAEMPFIGTREMYRRQGMCRLLLSAIESELCSLKVEKLIIPAISEHINTWTTVFGFHELEDVHKKEIKSMNMVVFPGINMLQKQLLKQEAFDVGVKVSESTEKKPQLPVLVEKSDDKSSLEHKAQASSSSVVSDVSMSNDAVDPLDSDPPAPAVPSNDETAASVSDAHHDSDTHLVSRESDKPGGKNKTLDPVNEKSIPSNDETAAGASDAPHDSDTHLVSGESDKTDGKNETPDSVNEKPVPSNDGTAPIAPDARHDPDTHLVNGESEKPDGVNEKPDPVNEKPVPSNDETAASASDAPCDSDTHLVSGESDKPDGKSKTPDAVDEKVASPVSCETSAQNVATSEKQIDSSECADKES